MAHKFTAQDIAKYKELKKLIDADLKVLKTFALWKSPTATNFNKVKMSQIWELYEAGVQLGDKFRQLSNFAYKDYKLASDAYYDNKTIPAGTLSARGWHKDHYNYNKAEKHERTPGQRRTPARNVTRTGAKRIRKTNIKRYK